MKKIVIFFFLIISIILFLVISPLIIRISHMIGVTDNNRLITIPLPDSRNIQLPPPKTLLVNYMTKKYGVKFEIYSGDEYVYYNTGEPYHTSLDSFEYYGNGILVQTKEYPNHYFFVQSRYGKFFDDYCLHIKHFEMESKLYDILDNTIDKDFKVVCLPLYHQIYNISSDDDIDYILRNGNYIIVIYLKNYTSNTDSFDDDLNDQIYLVLSEYLYRDINKMIIINSVNSCEFSDIDSDKIVNSENFVKDIYSDNIK